MDESRPAITHIARELVVERLPVGQRVEVVRVKADTLQRIVCARELQCRCPAWREQQHIAFMHGMLALVLLDVRFRDGYPAPGAEHEVEFPFEHDAAFRSGGPVQPSAVDDRYAV